MGFLNGKKLLITGVISNRSIAYGIAKACRREGAELAFTYANERYRERIEGLAAAFCWTKSLKNPVPCMKWSGFSVLPTERSRPGAAPLPGIPFLRNSA